MSHRAEMPIWRDGDHRDAVVRFGYSVCERTRGSVHVQRAPATAVVRRLSSRVADRPRKSLAMTINDAKTGDRDWWGPTLESN